MHTTSIIHEKSKAAQIDTGMAQSERIKKNNIKISKKIKKEEREAEIMNNELTELNVKIKKFEDELKKAEDEKKDKRNRYDIASEKLKENRTEENKKNSSVAYKADKNAREYYMETYKKLNELKINKSQLTKKINKIKHPESALRLREILQNLKDKVNGYENHKKQIENDIAEAQKNYNLTREQLDKSDGSKYITNLSHYNTSVSTLAKHQKEYEKLKLSFSMKPKQIDNIISKILIADRKEQLAINDLLKKNNIELNIIDEQIKELESNNEIYDNNKFSDLKKNKELLNNKIASLHIELNNKNNVIKMNDDIKQLKLEESAENSKETKIKISILEKKIYVNDIKNRLIINIESQLEIDDKIKLNKSQENLNKHKDLSNNIIYFNNRLGRLEKEIINLESEYNEYKETQKIKNNSQTKLNNEKLNSLETIAIQHKSEPSEGVRSVMASITPLDRVSFTYGILSSYLPSTENILLSTVK